MKITNSPNHRDGGFPDEAHDLLVESGERVDIYVSGGGGIRTRYEHKVSTERALQTLAGLSTASSVAVQEAN